MPERPIAQDDNFEPDQDQKGRTVSQASIAFDWQEWLPFIEGSDLDEAQKRELIETLWQIVLGFVDLGFEVGALKDCGGQTIDLNAVLRGSVVSLEEESLRKSKDLRRPLRKEQNNNKEDL